MDLTQLITAAEQLAPQDIERLAHYLFLGIEPVPAQLVTIAKNADGKITVTLADGRVATPNASEHGLMQIAWHAQTHTPQIDNAREALTVPSESVPLDKALWVAEVGTKHVPVIIPDHWAVESW